MINDYLIRADLYKKLEDTKIICTEKGSYLLGHYVFSDMMEPDFGPIELAEKDALLVKLAKNAYIRPSDIKSHLDYFLLGYLIRNYESDYKYRILLEAIDNDRVLWDAPARTKTGSNFVDARTSKDASLNNFKTLRRIKKEYK